MEHPRETALRTGDIANQQALVEALTPQTVRTKKWTIPAGKTMLDQLDKESLGRAVNNWLKGCREFQEVTISFAKDPSKWNTKPKKVVDFDHKGKYEIWATHRDGKAFLAKHLTEALLEHKPVFVKATKDGVWVYEDSTGTFSPYNENGEPSDDWEPYIEFLPKRTSRYGR